MRIILTMVGITLGLAIAVVAGVYGWQEYSTRQEIAAAQVAQSPTETPPIRESKPVAPPAAAPKPEPSRTPAPTTMPKPSTPLSPPVPSPAAAKPATPAATSTQPAPAPATIAAKPPVPTPSAEDKPIAVPEAQNAATADKLDKLTTGMTEGQVQETMGKAGVTTPEAQLPAYTPEGWFEVRWPNADGSYIGVLFSDQRTLAHVEPFNMPGAYAYLATPTYAVPKWLNEKLQSNNMIVRVPAVQAVEAQAGSFQFQGPLVNADGQILGSISGTYYTNDPQGRFTRGMEGSYSYTLANGATDANTFQFTE